MATNPTDYPAALLAAGAASDERTIRGLNIPDPSTVSAWSETINYDRVEGHLTWPDFGQGNAILATVGSNPDRPQSIRISPGQLLGRAAGDIESLRLADLQALSTSSVADFYDITTPVAAAGNTLVEQGDGSYQFEKLNLSNLGDAPSGYGTTGQVLKTDGSSSASWSDNALVVGTTAPTTTDGTVIWLNTNSGVNETFFYDTSRSKWLSTRLIELTFVESTGSLATDAYFRIPGLGTATSTTGYYLNHDVTVVGFEYSASTAASSGGHGIYLTKDGTVADGGSNVATDPTGTASTRGVYAKDSDGTAGVYQAAVASGPSGAGITMKWLLRRRAS
jgi:hypothetical protein